MQVHMWLVLSLVGAVQAFAAPKITFKTALTCQQDEGDQWVEFGLRQEAGRWQAFVVAHDTDEGSAKLVARRFVTFPMSIPGKTVWVDAQRTLKITVFTGSNGRQTASLSLLVDGPGSIREEGMRCYRNSKISFDSWPHR